ncbi:MAG: hypothetical protein ACI4L5_02570 [Negativibacillus sp.]
MKNRRESIVVIQARRKVHKIIRQLIADIRQQESEIEDDLYARQDLNSLADQVEKAVFGDD